MDKSSSKVLIIVPCYDEEENIEKVIRTLERLPFDYIAVNDGSKDETLNIIRKNRFVHLNLCNNLGIGGAVQAGYRYAYAKGYDIAVQFDGDGQHSAESIQDIIDPIEQNGMDMVIGSRFIQGKSKFKSSAARRVGIRLLSAALYFFTGQVIKDVTSGFRAVNRRTIEYFVKKYPYEYPEPVTDFELCYHGFRVQEIAVKMSEREHGESSIGGLSSAYYMLNVLFQFIGIKLFERKEQDA